MNQVDYKKREQIDRMVHLMAFAFATDDFDLADKINHEIEEKSREVEK